MRFFASIFTSVGEPPYRGLFWGEFNCSIAEMIARLRISAIALGDSTYLVPGDNCHPEVVASATSVVNRYPSIHVPNTPPAKRTNGQTVRPESVSEVKMSVRTSRKAISSALCMKGMKRNERGISGVTIAVVLAAFAVVALTIVQAATSGDVPAAQSGIPALIG